MRQTGMRRTARSAVAVAALLTLSGCASDGGNTGPSSEPFTGGTVTSPSAQPSSGQPGAVPPTPGGTPPPGASQTDTPALPIPSRPVKPGTSGTVTVTGTIAYGVEPNCVLLNGYLLLGGPRDLFAAGALVTVTGRIQPDMMTTCQQGTPLVVESAQRG
jgi:hypothetical protein